jgi:hypothetical protein
MTKRKIERSAGRIFTQPYGGQRNQCSDKQDAASRAAALDWNSWNHFATSVSDADKRAAADALVSSGFRDARLCLCQYR